MLKSDSEPLILYWLAFPDPYKIRRLHRNYFYPQFFFPIGLAFFLSLTPKTRLKLNYRLSFFFCKNITNWPSREATVIWKVFNLLLSHWSNSFISLPKLQIQFILSGSCPDNQSPENRDTDNRWSTVVEVIFFLL